MSKLSKLPIELKPLIIGVEKTATIPKKHMTCLINQKIGVMTKDFMTNIIEAILLMT